MEKKVPEKLRNPLFGLYKLVFGCNMKEAEESNLKQYTSFKDLFIRKLKQGSRVIDKDHLLVSPVDGRVLHFGSVESNYIEQVKGVKYSMNAFLGPDVAQTLKTETDDDAETKLFHCVFYLSPGDCHHFYSPSNWKPTLLRHFPGELLTVAPWAAQKMPGLFALNERITLSGSWKYGRFIFAAVGAYNVGSMSIDLHEDLQTNEKGHYMYGSYSEKQIESLLKEDKNSEMVKGDHIGVFTMGSSIVLIFEAPKAFQFTVTQNQTIKIGQPLGTISEVEI